MNLVRSVPIGQGHSGDQLLLRPLELSDAADLAGAYLRNRGHLAPWEPTRDDGFFTEHGQEAVIRAKIDQYAAGSEVPWVITGDRGDDIVYGGAGADLFHGSQDQGIDWLMDFSVAEGDRVMLDPGTTYAVFQEGAHVIVDTGGGNRMILAQTELSTLTPGWIFESWTY